MTSLILSSLPAVAAAVTEVRQLQHITALKMANNIEQLVLIDAESNSEYTMTVSLEDANKARNDHKFAYSLLENAKRSMNVDLNRRVISESENTDDTTDAVASCSSENDTTSELKDQHAWTRSETMLLINIYKEHMTKFSNPKISTKQCWSILSKEMEHAGYKIPPIKCATKFQSLKRTYKSVTDHNKKSGNNRKHWEYYEIMHEIFGAKPWIEPQATAGSNVAITNTDIENKDPKAPKKRKINHVVEDYFEKSIRLKEEKEKSAQKRHEEKMAYLAKIENLMTKIYDK